MKRILVPLLLSCALWLACPLSGGIGAGSQADEWLNDPEIGLDGLDNYRATLNISFSGTLDGQSVDSIDAYVQTEWPQQSARFTTIDTTDDSGQRVFIVAGAVGEAQYSQASIDGPCMVDWGAAAGDPSEFRAASLLPAVGAAKLAGEETIEGVATRHYTFDAASLGLPADVTAGGEAWIAKDGGYVMKYVLDITGSESVFGQGAQGTRHVEYSLTEVNSLPDVIYPAGCTPVLTSVPAMEDATDLTRLPGLLDYSTNAAADDVHAFYVDQLALLGWEEYSAPGQGADQAVWTFARSDTGAVAFIAVETDGASRWVTVMMPNAESAAASTTGPATTPAPSTDPSARVSLALTVLLGMVPSQPAPLSFHLEAVNQVPVAAGGSIALSQDVMSADVQGENVHFTHRKTPPGGSVRTTEVYIIGDQEYEVLNGQVQPPGDGLASLDWTLWPLDLELMLATGSTSAAAAGTEVLDGRTAEVYELDATSGTLSGATGIGLPVTAIAGRVWVDQETGALLKAVLSYQADVKDSHGNLIGSETGHLEITVTQVGQVNVTLP